MGSTRNPVCGAWLSRKLYRLLHTHIKMCILCQYIWLKVRQKGVYKPSDVDFVWLSAVSATPTSILLKSSFCWSDHWTPRCVLFRPFVAVDQIETWWTSGVQAEGDTLGQRDRVGALRWSWTIHPSNFKYAKDWEFTVVLDVYNPHYYKPESPIWVAESDAEEAEAERPKPKLLESRPKAKAKAASSRATAEEVEEIEEEEVVTTSMRTFPKIDKVPVQKEKPSHILPDLVVLYEKGDQGNFVQTRDTRFFAGYRSYYSTEQNIQLQAKGKGFYESTKLAVFVDYHQVLDRSYSESAWGSGALPRDSVTFLRKVKESAGKVLVTEIQFSWQFYPTLKVHQRTKQACCRTSTTHRSDQRT